MKTEKQTDFHLEIPLKKILDEANKEYFASKDESGTKFRITELQGKCVIRALLKSQEE